MVEFPLFFFSSWFKIRVPRHYINLMMSGGWTRNLIDIEPSASKRAGNGAAYVTILRFQIQVIFDYLSRIDL